MPPCRTMPLLSFFVYFKGRRLPFLWLQTSELHRYGPRYSMMVKFLLLQMHAAFLALNFFVETTTGFVVGSHSTPFLSIPASTFTLRRFTNDESIDSLASRTAAEMHRQEWINRSVKYYSKVMREERRRNLGQAINYQSPEYQEEFVKQAKKHYFALRKIKDGKPQHAELIYRRIIDDILEKEVDDDHQCNQSQLAVTTLLLALHTQRSDKENKKATRSVFLHFFRIVSQGQEQGHLTQCACSAKVLQAFALFEMKQGNALRSLELARKATKLDPALKPVLKWKQFRTASERRASDLKSYNGENGEVSNSLPLSTIEGR